MSKDEHSYDYVQVAIASGEMDAQVIRSLLEGSGIESVMKGEALRLTHGLTVDGLGEVRIMVRKEDEERARTLIEDYRSPDS